MKEHSMFASK